VGARRDLRAAALLTVALLRRLAREGLVVRSLSFPIALTLGTLVLTVGFVAWLRYTPTVALSPELATDSLQVALVDGGFRPIVVDDPHAALTDGTAWAATDGHTLWMRGGGPGALVVESLVRRHVAASWRPDADVPRPGLSAATAMGRRVVVLLGVLFALYGVVFGAGMVARDRDDGTFEVELSLGVSRWVHGAARLVAGSSVLAAFLILGVALCGAILGLDDPLAMTRHALACAAGSTAIGLLAIGRGGLQAGFTGPLALGMSVATGLLGVGVAAPGLGAWLPLASLTTAGSGWEALVGAAALSGVALALFTWRSASV
jgi:hypothetical protein